MNSKSTWVWITLAAVLGASIFGVEKFGRNPPAVLVALVPGLRADKVTSVQFAPAGQLEIRANRTNGVWRLAKPISYPAPAPFPADASGQGIQPFPIPPASGQGVM